jgi:sodium-coupled neutral amino acid transporter 11
MSIVAANWGGVDIVAHPWIKRVVLTTIATGGVLPLACLKDMAKLSKTSFLSLMSVIFITLVVVIRCIGGPGDAKQPVTEEDRTLHVIDINFFPAIGVIAFAFVCHHACFIVYNTLRDNTEARWNKTVHISLGVAFCIMIVLAMSA